MKQVFSIFVLFAVTTLLFTACSNDKNAGTTTEAAGTKEQAAADEMYTCTMHSEVMSRNAGTCPKCGMTLEKKKMSAAQGKMMKENTYVKSKEEQ